MPGKKIFISYSRLDGEAFALKLAGDLKNAGVNIWVDQLNIALGKIWDTEIETALASSECVLFIATEKSIASVNVLNEVYYALEENKQVIPVIAGDCKLPFRLKRLQYIDFTGDYDKALKGLLEALHTNESRSAEPTTNEAQVNPLPEVKKDVSKPAEIISKQEVPGIKEEPGPIPQERSITSFGNTKPKKIMPLMIGIIVVLLVFVGWLLIKGKNGDEEGLTSGPDNNKIESAANRTESMQQRNKRIVLENINAVNSRDVEAFAKDLSPDIMEYGDYSIPPIKGVDTIKKNMELFFKAFPDYRGSDIRAVAEGDSVTVYARWRGTFKNDLPWLRATGKSFDYTDVDIFKLNADGKIISHSNTSAGVHAFESVMTENVRKK